MEYLNHVLANNMKQIREDRKLSLDQVSKQTGVSKSMLGQIERGESNPTVSTVWKIANGLKISFTALIKEPQSDSQLVLKSDIAPLIEDKGKYVLYPLFPFEDSSKFEIFSADIEKGGYLSAEAHIDGTIEYITVYEGEVTVQVDDIEYCITEGNALKFKADKAHSYHNSGDKLAKISLILHYV